MVGAMTDLQEQEPAAPTTDAMFTPGDPVETLWVKSYQGEVLGEVFFGVIADQLTDQIGRASCRERV